MSGDVKHRPVKSAVSGDDWVVVQGNNAGLGTEKRIKVSDLVNYTSRVGFSDQIAKPLIVYAQTAAELGIYTVKNMETGCLTVAGLSSETVALVPLYNDTVDVGTSKVAVRNASGEIVQASALTNGTYTFESMPFDKFQITKSGSSQAVTISGELRSEHTNERPVVSVFSDVTAAAVGRFPCANFASAEVTISGLSGGETIRLAPVFSDGVTVASRGVLVKNASDVISEALTLANGTYVVETVAFQHIEIIKSAGVNSVTVTIEAK